MQPDRVRWVSTSYRAYAGFLCLFGLFLLVGSVVKIGTGGVTPMVGAKMVGIALATLGATLWIYMGGVIELSDDSVAVRSWIRWNRIPLSSIDQAIVGSTTSFVPVRSFHAPQLLLKDGSSVTISEFFSGRVDSVVDEVVARINDALAKGSTGRAG